MPINLSITFVEKVENIQEVDKVLASGLHMASWKEKKIKHSLWFTPNDSLLHVTYPDGVREWWRVKVEY